MVVANNEKISTLDNRSARNVMLTNGTSSANIVLAMLINMSITRRRYDRDLSISITYLSLLVDPLLMTA